VGKDLQMLNGRPKMPTHPRMIAMEQPLGGGGCSGDSLFDGGQLLR